MLCRPHLGATLIFDLYTSVLTVYGWREGAVVGFNPTKRGRPSYLPLLCFEGKTADVFSGSYHSGNTHPGTVIRPLLKDVFGKLPGAVRRVRVRAEGAFFDHKIIVFIEGKQALFVIVARLTRNRFGTALVGFATDAVDRKCGQESFATVPRAGNAPKGLSQFVDRFQKNRRRNCICFKWDDTRIKSLSPIFL